MVLKAEILSDTARASLSGVFVPVSPARVTVDPTACVRVWGLGKTFWGWFRVWELGSRFKGLGLTISGKPSFQSGICLRRFLLRVDHESREYHVLGELEGEGEGVDAPREGR